MIWTIIKSLLGLGGEALATWQANRAKVKEAEHELRLAYIKNKTRLMLSKDEYNHEWEMKALMKSSTSLKWGSFALFAGPIALTWILALLDEAGMAARAWDAMNLVPEYWRYCYTAITGSIWGVAYLKDMGGVRSLVGSFTKGGQSRVFIAPPKTVGEEQAAELDAALDPKADPTDLIKTLTR